MIVMYIFLSEVIFYFDLSFCQLFYYLQATPVLVARYWDFLPQCIALLYILFQSWICKKIQIKNKECHESKLQKKKKLQYL